MDRVLIDTPAGRKRLEPDEGSPAAGSDQDRRVVLDTAALELRPS
jgi:hypothetical protein